MALFNIFDIASSHVVRLVLSISIDSTKIGYAGYAHRERLWRHTVRSLFVLRPSIQKLFWLMQLAETIIFLMKDDFSGRGSLYTTNTRKRTLWFGCGWDVTTNVTSRGSASGS